MNLSISRPGEPKPPRPNPRRSSASMPKTEVHRPVPATAPPPSVHSRPATAGSCKTVSEIAAPRLVGPHHAPGSPPSPTECEWKPRETTSVCPQPGPGLSASRSPPLTPVGLLMEGRRRAPRERERARDQASGRARIRASRSPVRPTGAQIPTERKRHMERATGIEPATSSYVRAVLTLATGATPESPPADAPFTASLNSAESPATTRAGEFACWLASNQPVHNCRRGSNGRLVPAAILAIARVTGKQPRQGEVAR